MRRPRCGLARRSPGGPVRAGLRRAGTAGAHRRCGPRPRRRAARPRVARHDRIGGRAQGGVERGVLLGGVGPRGLWHVEGGVWNRRSSPTATPGEAAKPVTTPSSRAPAVPRSGTATGSGSAAVSTVVASSGSSNRRAASAWAPAIASLAPGPSARTSTSWPHARRASPLRSGCSRRQGRHPS